MLKHHLPPWLLVPLIPARACSRLKSLLVKRSQHFNCPQRSCEGYVFTPVCHSVHKGGVCLSACWDTPRKEAPPPGRKPSREGSTLLGRKHPPERKHPPGKEAPNPWEGSTPRKEALPGKETPPREGSTAWKGSTPDSIDVLTLYIKYASSSSPSISRTEIRL